MARGDTSRYKKEEVKKKELEALNTSILSIFLRSEKKGAN